jgi:predicted 3-demethylubiquinone-9 3-methyltransferase (glyoxalase superfamily)
LHDRAIATAIPPPCFTSAHDVMTEITTFLMFEGTAEAAMNFYLAAFPGASIDKIERYGEEGPGRAGSVTLAAFTLAGHKFMCIDSPVHHGFTFTPSISLYVTCDSAAEVDRLYAVLSDGGQTMMALDKYPFSERFAWCADKFGVSWQIALAAAPKSPHR